MGVGGTKYYYYSQADSRYPYQPPGVNDENQLIQKPIID